ncbi:DUF1524 domain-containing protein [Micromonospora sp. B11E3]|uniref:GmrSD restriction endonuclease domain-containing protein n=1 Tax=Micromonospora sp. B11E3 TaxID=3153562 RepID=UPI00325E1811
MHEALLHTLGNLTLTGYKPELGNKPFAAKRAELEKSGIRLSQKIVRRTGGDVRRSSPAPTPSPSR